MKKESNEIDLLELLAKVYFVFKRNKYILLTFAIIGLIVGIYKSTKTDPYYSTEMVVKTSLENEMVLSQLQSLTQLKQEGNKNSLAQELNLTEEEVEEIKSIEVEEVEESSLIRITLEVFSNGLISKIQEGIVNFSETNEYIQTQLKNRQEHYRQYLNEISDALELLSKKENKQISNQSSMEIDLSGGDSYSSQITQLLDKKGGLETTLNRIEKPLIIVKDFYTPENEQTDTAIKIAIYFVIGLFIGIIVVIGLFLIKKIENYNKN